MADDPTKKSDPEDKPPTPDSSELKDEDLQKVSGGAYEFYHRASVKLPGGGVHESAPVDPPEPQPAIKISQG